MKMEGVMEELDRLGYFKKNIEFYKLWVDIWASKKNKQMIDKIVTLAKVNCQLSNAESDNHFG